MKEKASQEFYVYAAQGHHSLFCGDFLYIANVASAVVMNT